MRIFNAQYATAEEESPVSSFEVLAKTSTVVEKERNLFFLLLHHFLERFFNNEMVSSDDDGKARLIQVACAAGVPGLVVAMYLWPLYHPIRGPLPSYWACVDHHFFFPMYSFVAMGIITIFEWDMFFPDLLDTFVLSTLPLAPLKIFLARITAVGIFIIGFLFDSNILATFILPVAIDPPNLIRFLSAHILSVTASGLFTATFILSLQGILLALIGERFFRRISFLLQGIFITGLLVLLLLFPILTGVMPTLLQSPNSHVLYFPPFWFLGIYERLLEGPAALPIYAKLAQIGFLATLLTTMLAVLSYPVAYWRKTRQLILGSGAQHRQQWTVHSMSKVLHTILRKAEYRAIYHFISQTLPRIQRYRIYLVMYGGLGLSLIVANVLQLTSRSGHIIFGISSKGLRFAVPVAAFWVVTGLRLAFLSPTDQRTNWTFRIVHQKPVLELLTASKIWVWIYSMAVTLSIVALSRILAPPDFQGWRIAFGQIVVATGLCLLLTDFFFLNVKIVPFTGIRTETRQNLAIILLKYFSFFPLTIWFTLSYEPQIEASVANILLTAGLIIALHAALRIVHWRVINYHLNLPELENEDELLMQLGLRR